MDQSAFAMLEKRIGTVIANLGKNNIEAFYAPTRADALRLSQGFLTPGCRVAVGGSVTLREVGVQQYIETGNFVYTGRYIPGTFEIDRELSDAVRRQSLLDAYSADVYFTSTNAVTMAGELVNVDGQGNRTSAMIFGPRKVVVVAGYNKIVADVPAAFERIKSWAAPANNLRHGYDSACTKTGRCVDCRNDSRACSNFSIMTRQRDRARVKVILVGEALGY